jgi:hypothetical protein
MKIRFFCAMALYYDLPVYRDALQLVKSLNSVKGRFWPESANSS